MKIEFICDNTFKHEYMNGVNQKIRNQVKGLKENGVIVNLQVLNRAPKLIRILPFSTSSWCYNQINITDDVDAVYIRFLSTDFQILRTFRKWKIENPRLKIILEMPSYPNDQELREILPILFYFRERIYRKYLKKYVDVVAIYSKYDSVFGIPALKVVNCIDVDGVSKLGNHCYHNNQLNILIVATVSKYHGCDRVINGLKDYYSNKENDKQKVIFHLVGHGPEIKELKNMVASMKLENVVLFYGVKTGEELKKLYEIADIGVDGLGAHRKGDNWFATLKSREYLAKGLPFITEYDLPSEVDDISKYLFKVPSDDTPINIEALVDHFSANCACGIEKMRNEMHVCAKNYCDYIVAMKPIAEWLNNNTQG